MALHQYPSGATASIVTYPYRTTWPGVWDTAAIYLDGFFDPARNAGGTIKAAPTAGFFSKPNPRRTVA